MLTINLMVSPRRLPLSPKERMARWRAANPERARAAHRRASGSREGSVQFAAALRSGKGAYHVDHDHLTNKVRGLLCHHCNIGLGNFRDNLAVLERAAVYLKRSGT